MKNRCTWANSDPLSMDYHDNEWGVTEHDDRKLFEMLILEGAQAGLSWITILKKRENYKKAFDNFDATKVAKYGRYTSCSLMLKMHFAVSNRNSTYDRFTIKKKTAPIM